MPGIDQKALVGWFHYLRSFSFLSETKGLERLQTVRTINGSTYSQKDGVEANFACSSPHVLTKHAVQSIGSWVWYLC